MQLFESFNALEENSSEEAVSYVTGVPAPLPTIVTQVRFDFLSELASRRMTHACNEL